MTVTILVGDVRDKLATLPDESVQCVVTSPPYYALRSYLPADHPDKPNEIGSEGTLAAYIDTMVDVFREVRRVLRPDGTLWLNIGDSYAGGGNGTRDPERWPKQSRNNGGDRAIHAKKGTGLKPKDLMMVPARVAIALQDDGWFLRSHIIWHKKAPMPESVTDRPTSAHESIFLLTKSARYYWDAEAVREPMVKGAAGSSFTDGKTGINGMGRVSEIEREDNPDGRNLRNVWTLGPDPFPGAHFAVMPREIARRCIKAGTSERGACRACGTPWRQSGPGCACDMGGVYKSDDFAVIETPTGERAGDDPTMQTGRKGLNRPRGEEEGTRPITRYEQRAYARQLRYSPFRDEMERHAGRAFEHYIRTDMSGARPVPDDLLRDWIGRGWIERVTVPERNPYPVVPCTVLDPFGGAGTVGLVADELGRNAILIELNAAYAQMAKERIVGASPMFADVVLEAA